MQIRFSGVRGSTPAPGIDFIRYGGHTPCLALAHDGASAPTLVLDAGTGLQAVTETLGGGPFLGTLLLTHLHWDHVLGLPFFAAGDRTDSQVAVVLPEQEDGAEASSVLARIMTPPFFPVEATELRGRWTFATIAPGEHEIEGFSVLAREIPHKGGRTFGYRISDGRTTLTYMPDHCPTAFGYGEDGFGEYHPAAMELADRVDVLVHDAQMFPEELAAQERFGHSVADYAVELARRARAQSVVLFHHAHRRTDEQLDGLARRLSCPAPEVIVAAQGTTLRL